MGISKFILHAPQMKAPKQMHLTGQASLSFTFLLLSIQGIVRGFSSYFFPIQYTPPKKPEMQKVSIFQALQFYFSWKRIAECLFLFSLVRKLYYANDTNDVLNYTISHCPSDGKFTRHHYHLHTAYYLLLNPCDRYLS